MVHARVCVMVRIILGMDSASELMSMTGQVQMMAVVELWQ